MNGGRKPPKIPLTHFSLKKGGNKNRSLPNPWVSVHPWQLLSLALERLDIIASATLYPGTRASETGNVKARDKDKNEKDICGAPTSAKH